MRTWWRSTFASFLVCATANSRLDLNGTDHGQRHQSQSFLGVDSSTKRRFAGKSAEGEANLKELVSAASSILYSSRPHLENHPSTHSLNQLNDKFQQVLGGLSMKKIVDAPVDVAALQQDVADISEQYGKGRPHYWAKEGWMLLPLLGCGGKLDSQLPCYNGEYSPKPKYPTETGIYQPTGAWERSKYIRPLLEPLQGALQRVRISHLLPGKVVRWHRDREIPFGLDIPLGLRSGMQFNHGLCRVHLIVNNPPTAHLRLGTEKIHANPGTIFCGDFTLPHTLWNNGKDVRTSILLDVLMDENILRNSELGSGILEAYRDMAAERSKDGRTRTEDFQRMTKLLAEQSNWPVGPDLFPE